MSLQNPERTTQLHDLLRERIVLLDGGMGTMIQQYALTEADYRGERFADHPCSLQGNADILNVTRPDVIKAIHMAYLEAGADIVETNTFNCSEPSQGDYQTEELVYELSKAGAALVREVCDALEATDGQPRFCAGVLGPTNRAASLSPDVNNPGFRNIRFDELVATYQTRPAACSTAAPTSCSSRPSSTRSTPRRRSTPSTPCSRSSAPRSR